MQAEEKRRLLEHIAAELGTDIDKIDRTLSKTIVRGVAFHHSGARHSPTARSDTH